MIIYFIENVFEICCLFYKANIKKKHKKEPAGFTYWLI